MSRVLARSFVVSIGLFAIGSTTSLRADDLDKTAVLAQSMTDALNQQDWASVIGFGERVLAIDPKHSLALHDVGYAYHAQGKLDRALEYHKRGAENPKYRAVACYNAGCAYALKGEADSAFQWLADAAKSGFAQAAMLDTDTDLNSLKADARWQEFRKQVEANAAGGQGNEGRMFASQKMKRAGTRVACFTNNGSEGAVAVEYGPIAWKEEYDEDLASGKFDGKRWRLGADFFTNLDANVPFTLGKERFSAGEYYLLLERTKSAEDKPQFNLWVVPASEVRTAHVDAFWAHQVTGGRSVVLNHSTSGKTANQLALTLATQDQASPVGSFSIQFGPHQLDTPFEIHIP